MTICVGRVHRPQGPNRLVLSGPPGGATFRRPACAASPDRGSRSAQDERGVVLVAALQLVLDACPAPRSRRPGPRTPRAPRSASTLDRPREAVVVERLRVGDAGVGHQALDPPAREQQLLLGHADPDGFASARAPGSRPRGSWRAGPPAGPVAVAARALELGLQDLGTTLYQPSQQREVLALGEAFVAALAELVEGRSSRPLTYPGSRIRSIRGSPGRSRALLEVDGVCGRGIVARPAGTRRRAFEPALSGRSADREEQLVRVDGCPPARVVARSGGGSCCRHSRCCRRTRSPCPQRRSRWPRSSTGARRRCSRRNRRHKPGALPRSSSSSRPSPGGRPRSESRRERSGRSLDGCGPRGASRRSRRTSSALPPGQRWIIPLETGVCPMRLSARAAACSALYFRVSSATRSW